MAAIGLCAPVFSQEGARMPARANVEAYDDESGIMKSAYRDSPYFMEFTG